jgi:hypothetical protein
MGSRSKRQMTAAKRAREQTLKDRRLLKQEKKQAGAARRAEAAAADSTALAEGSEDREAGLA